MFNFQPVLTSAQAPISARVEVAKGATTLCCSPTSLPAEKQRYIRKIYDCLIARYCAAENVARRVGGRHPEAQPALDSLYKPARVTSLRVLPLQEFALRYVKAKEPSLSSRRAPDVTKIWHVSDRTVSEPC